MTYISGPTGTGKTRNVLDAVGDANVYRVTEYIHPFDSYECEPNIIFEEFRSDLSLSSMLNYLDIYPIVLPARYSNRYACYHNVFIISNWPLEEQYRKIQREDPASWWAFLRRIHEIKIYNTDNSITTYSSVKEYINTISSVK